MTDIGDTASLDGIDAIDRSPEPDDDELRARVRRGRIAARRRKVT